MTNIKNIPIGRALLSMSISFAMLASLPGSQAKAASDVGAGIVGGIIGGVIAVCATGGCKRKERARPVYREERPRYRRERPRYRSERRYRSKKSRYNKRRVNKRKRKSRKVVVAKKPVFTAHHLIQQQLGTLGFYLGAINGNLSSNASREAIIGYQRTFGLSQSGFLRPETRIILRQQAELQNIKREFYNPAAASGRAMNLKIQASLKVLGLYQGKLDGSIGPQSRRSIIAFQQRNGFSPTSTLYGNQQDRLFTVAQAKINEQQNGFKTQLAYIANPAAPVATASNAGADSLRDFTSSETAVAERTASLSQESNVPATEVDAAGRPITQKITITPSNLNEGAIGKPDETLAKRDRPDAVAIIIGNKDYINKDIPDVTFAHRDADAMKKVFVEKFGVKMENIVDLRDATKSQIEQAFGNRDTVQETTLWSYVEPESDVYVFYSGHGMPTKVKGEAYILPVDADPNSPNISGYPLRRLYANLNKVKAKSITVFVEACFSGGSSAGMLVKNASPVFAQTNLDDLNKGNITVFTASRGTEIASWDTDARLGLFTNVAVNGLSGEADKGRFGNKDGVVTAGELQSYLSKNVRRKAKRTYKRLQTPVLDGNPEQKLSYLN